MKHYVVNNEYKCSIPKNILSHTLVILGAHNDEFSIWHNILYQQQKEGGFIIEKCYNNLDVKRAINLHRPQFLIFDCHGGYDKESNSTYLVIGKDKLTSEYIVKNNIGAPIVFLSACGTAPLYGISNPIANSFFEIGSLTVTSTFLPILISTSSILYLRILKNLETASQQVIHKNWLSFVSHTIRTSQISEAYQNVITTNKMSEGEKQKLLKENTLTLVDALQFEKRSYIWHNLDCKISQMVNNNNNSFTATIPEHLLYTILGRADLIHFEVWDEENRKINFGFKK